MNWLASAALILFLAAGAHAQDALEEHPNGDLTAPVALLSAGDVQQLKRDIPGSQGRCVEIQILDLQEFGMDKALMRIPAERHGIEFEPRGDGQVMTICARFSEDSYSWDGSLAYSVGYDEMAGY